MPPGLGWRSGLSTRHGGPSQNSVAEAVDTSEGTGVGGEEVGSIEEYGEEEALGDLVAEERSDACAGGGQSLDGGEGGSS